MSYVGFVEKINVHKGTSKSTGRPFTLYSLKLQQKDGTVIDGWFRNGFDDPGAKEGDYVKLEAQKSGENYDIVKGSIKVAKNAPPKPASQFEGRQKSGGGKGFSGGGAKVTTSELFGTIGGYNTEDDIRRMSYTAARDHAIQTAKLLLEQGALKLIKADSKAGAAARFDLITETIDKLTVIYFYDSATGRKLTSVADVEPSLKGDGELPDADEFDGEAPADDVEIDEFEDAVDEFGGDDDEFE